MNSNHEHFSSMRLAASGSGAFGKLFTLAAGAVLLVVALMFSLLALGVLLTVGLLGFAYLQWQTRAGISTNISRTTTGQPAARKASNEGAIEGEVIGDAEYDAPATSPPVADLPARYDQPRQPIADR